MRVLLRDFYSSSRRIRQLLPKFWNIVIDKVEMTKKRWNTDKFLFSFQLLPGHLRDIRCYHLNGRRDPPIHTAIEKDSKGGYRRRLEPGMALHWKLLWIWLQQNINLGGWMIGATQNKLEMKLEENCDDPRRCTSCNVFEKLVIQISFVKHAAHYKRAESPLCKFKWSNELLKVARVTHISAGTTITSPTRSSTSIPLLAVLTL